MDSITRHACNLHQQCGCSPRKAGIQHAGDLMDLMNPPDWQSTAESIARRETHGELLKERGDDVMVVRVPLHNGLKVIAKLWNRPTWKGMIRRLTRTNSGFREWQVLQRLREFGLSVPQPLAYVRLRGPTFRYTEALFSEDLGLCANLSDVIKDLVTRRNEAQLNSVEHELIDITETMIRGGVLDRDHRVTNFVQKQSGEITRIDFECGSCVTWYPYWRAHHGTMLGTLIGSYVFLVQPDTRRAVTFANRLAARLNPPLPVLRRTDRVIQDMLQLQRRDRNIDTSFPSTI